MGELMQECIKLMEQKLGAEDFTISFRCGQYTEVEDATAERAVMNVTP